MVPPFHGSSVCFGPFGRPGTTKSSIICELQCNSLLCRWIRDCLNRRNLVRPLLLQGPTTLRTGTPRDSSLLPLDTGCGSDLEVIIRVDGSWHKRSNKAALAWITLHVNSNTTSEYAVCLRTRSALQVKAMAVLSAFRWAHASQVAKISLFSDSEVLVRTFVSPSYDDISIFHTIQDIRRLAHTFQGCRILKVSRQEVALAHNLAKRCWMTHFPFTYH